jgi:hypothetical protein
MASIAIKFYSLWHLYLGLDNVTIQTDKSSEALAQVKERFGPHLQEQLRAHGVQVDGKIQDYSIIYLA